MATTMDEKTDKISMEQLAKDFGLPSWERLEELNEDYTGEAFVAAQKEALADGQSEEDAEEAGMDAEQVVRDELFGKWHDGVISAVGDLFAEHGLELTSASKGEYPFEYRVTPTTSWEDAALKIMTTINGVGQFEFNNLREFLDSGPYTPRQAVLSHLHWIKDWPEVYGERSARDRFDRAWR